MRRFSALIAISLLSAGPALAADMPVKAPPAPVASWTGFYFGASGGYMWARDDWSFPNAAGGSTAATSHRVDGVVFGGHVGYQIQSDRLIYGAEGGILAMLSNVRAESICTFPPPFQDRCDSLGPSKIYYAGGRLGFALSDPVMIYGTGGWAMAEQRSQIRFGTAVAPPGPGALTFTSTEMHHGWYLGGGMEYAMTRNVWLGLDYKHFEFEVQTHCGAVGCAPGLIDRNIGARADVVSARLSFRPFDR